MSRHDDQVRLRHMLDHAREATTLAKSSDLQKVVSDRLLNLALVRLLEIIGEAATRVSQEFRNGHPEIPWRSIVSLRNRLIHGYDEVDFGIMWTIINDDLPSLVGSLEILLEEKE